MAEPCSMGEQGPSAPKPTADGVAGSTETSRSLFPSAESLVSEREHKRPRVQPQPQEEDTKF